MFEVCHWKVVQSLQLRAKVILYFQPKMHNFYSIEFDYKSFFWKDPIREKEGKIFSISELKDTNLGLSLDECLNSKLNCSMFVFWTHLSKNVFQEIFSSGMIYDFFKFFKSWDTIHTWKLFNWIAKLISNSQAFCCIRLISLTNNEPLSNHREVGIIGKESIQ